MKFHGAGFRERWKDPEFRRKYYLKYRQKKLKKQYMEKSYSDDVDYRIVEHPYGVLMEARPYYKMNRHTYFAPKREPYYPWEDLC